MEDNNKTPVTAERSKRGAAINLVLPLLPLEVETATDNTLWEFSPPCKSHASLCTTHCLSVMSWGEWVLWKSSFSIWERINHSPERAGSLCQHSCTEKWAAGEILQLVYTEYRTPRPWTFSPSRVSSCTPPPFLPSFPWAPGRGRKIYTAVPLKCWLSMFTGIVYTEN